MFLVETSSRNGWCAAKWWRKDWRCLVNETIDGKVNTGTIESAKISSLYGVCLALLQGRTFVNATSSRFTC